MKDDPSLAATGGGQTGPARRRVCLALQGGGAHGAFTWGVCERLLKDDRLEIEGICGTSAGAMNAAGWCWKPCANTGATTRCVRSRRLRSMRALRGAMRWW